MIAYTLHTERSTEHHYHTGQDGLIAGYISSLDSTHGGTITWSNTSRGTTLCVNNPIGVRTENDSHVRGGFSLEAPPSGVYSVYGTDRMSKMQGICSDYGHVPHAGRVAVHAVAPVSKLLGLLVMGETHQPLKF